MNYERFIHYDPDIEDAVIGICLNEPHAFSQIVGILEAEHFYFEPNQIIFECMSEMWDSGQQIDAFTVNNRIYRKGKQDVFNFNPPFALTQKQNIVASDAHILSHAAIIRQLYAEREIMRIQAEAGKNDGDSISKMIDLQDQIKKVLSVQSTDDWHDLSQVMMVLSHHMDVVKGKDLLGIPTGFKTLDQITYGLQPGQLIVIGARPSVGKSAFLGKIAINAAKKGYKTGVIELEMPEDQIGGRLAALYSGVEFWRIWRNRPKDDSQEKNIFESISDMAGLPIWISDKTNVTSSSIRAKAEKLKKRSGLDLLMIDYLQLVDAEGKRNDTREREIAKLSRDLKLMSKDMGIPIIILVQLNREASKGHEKPRMNMIRESGAIEQDADVIILLHRDWMAGIEKDSSGVSTERQATIIVDKNRNGSRMEIGISFDPETMNFYEEDQTSSFRSVNYRDYSEPQTEEEAPF